jgi:hypothetical protein
MILRFRQSIRIAPGIRINFSKTGVSASIGGQPLTLNIGRKGVRGTASAPGTGLSVSKAVGFADLKEDEPQPQTAPLPTEDAGEGSRFVQTALFALVLMAVLWGVAAYSSRPAPEPAIAAQPPAAASEPAPKAPPQHTKQHK